MTALQINQVVCGNCLEVMRDFPSESVNFVMFSPPYWGLRDYGVEGQFGLEPTYQMYVEHLVEVGREIKRILRKDGSWYLNLGDTYAGSCTGHTGPAPTKWQNLPRSEGKSLQSQIKDIPAKCKLLIPYRVALALIGDGWICRNDITWHKPNAMPASVKDRLNTTTERVFHFVKSQKYYYDLDAIREPHKTPIEDLNRRIKEDRDRGGALKFGLKTKQTSTSCFIDSVTERTTNPLGKNPGDVVELTKHDIAVGRVGGFSYPDPLHTKEYHPAGKNPGDVTISDATTYNPKRKRTGLPGEHWKRGQPVGPAGYNENGKNPGDVVKTEWKMKELVKQGFHGKGSIADKGHSGYYDKEGNLLVNPLGANPGDFWTINTRPFPEAHFAVYPEELCVRPIKSSCPPNGIVLDPMCGAGTTLVVAKRLGMRIIGIDINPDYCEMARRRLTDVEFRLEAFT